MTTLDCKLDALEVASKSTSRCPRAILRLRDTATLQTICKQPFIPPLVLLCRAGTSVRVACRGRLRGGGAKYVVGQKGQPEDACFPVRCSLKMCRPSCVCTSLEERGFNDQEPEVPPRFGEETSGSTSVTYGLPKSTINEQSSSPELADCAYSRL